MQQLCKDFVWESIPYDTERRTVDNLCQLPRAAILTSQSVLTDIYHVSHRSKNRVVCSLCQDDLVGMWHKETFIGWPQSQRFDMIPQRRQELPDVVCVISNAPSERHYGEK